MPNYAEMMGLQGMQPKQTKLELDEDAIMELLAQRQQYGDPHKADGGDYAEANPYGPGEAAKAMEVVDKSLGAIEAVGEMTGAPNPLQGMMGQMGGVPPQQEEEMEQGGGDGQYSKEELRDALLERVSEEKGNSEMYQDKVMNMNKQRQKQRPMPPQGMPQ